MSETDLTTRLERLERDNRRLKGFALAAVVVASALASIFAAQPVPDAIAAHAFEVVDSSGKVRVLINAEYDKLRERGPGVTIFNDQGKAQVGMTVAMHSCWLDLSDERGDPRLEAGVDGIGQSSVTLHDAQKDARLSLSLDDSGEPRIWLSDPAGFRMELGSTHTITPATGQTQKTSAASIVMFGNDKDHHVIWQAP